MSDDIILIRDLVKKFGDFVAVNSINFGVRRGEVLGFLGPNGAGKTTTIKMIMGLTSITSGEVIVDGLDIRRSRIKVKEKLGYMSQKFSLYPKLSSKENIEFFSGISGLGKEAIRSKVSEIKKIIPPGLIDTPVEKLPPGMKQKVALFSALIPDPEILLLDEPTSGVDPEVRRNFWQEIYSLKKSGKTVMVTTHNLDEVAYADRIVILHRGNIIVEGEPSELVRKYKVDSVETLFREAVKDDEGN
jgi:ABC-2 type transport system ATP-binding protein